MNRDFIVNLLPLIVAAIKGAPKAIEVLENIVSAIKDGVTDEELLAITTQAHQELQELIDMTEPDSPSA